MLRCRSRRDGGRRESRKCGHVELDYEKKIQVTESETEEGVRNIRIKFDQRQTGHDQNSLFAGGNQKGRKEKGKISYNTKGYQQNGSTVSINAVRSIVIFDRTPSLS